MPPPASVYGGHSCCGLRWSCGLDEAAHDLADPPRVRTDFGVNGRRRRVVAAGPEPQEALQLAVAHQHGAVIALEEEKERGGGEGKGRSGDEETRR